MDDATGAPPGVLVVGASISIARLHGEACWTCGAVNTRLRAIGEVATVVPGGFRIWPVVGCPEHPSLDGAK